MGESPRLADASMTEIDQEFMNDSHGTNWSVRKYILTKSVCNVILLFFKDQVD